MNGHRDAKKHRRFERFLSNNVSVEQNMTLELCLSVLSRSWPNVDESNKESPWKNTDRTSVYFTTIWYQKERLTLLSGI